MLDGFCEYLRQQGKSENTVKAYSQGMKDYMRWYEETFGKRMKVLLRPNVLDYISYLRTVKGLSNRSVNAKLASLHSFNLYLISAGYKTEMVLTKQDYLKVQSAYASPSTVTKADVERFRQAKLLVTRENAVELEEDEYFIADLIGINVTSDEGEELGTIKDVLQTGANDVYVIAKENTPDLLVPAIHDCVLAVDIEAQTMTVHLLEGLR